MTVEQTELMLAGGFSAVKVKARKQPRSKATGQWLKQQGMRAVYEAAAAEWRAEALLKIRVWSASEADPEKAYAFEEIRAHLRDKGLKNPHHHNVWGALASAAVREGIIEPTGQYIKAQSPATRGHPVQTYRVIK